MTNKALRIMIADPQHFPRLRSAKLKQERSTF